MGCPPSQSENELPDAVDKFKLYFSFVRNWDIFQGISKVDLIHRDRRPRARGLRMNIVSVIKQESAQPGEGAELQSFNSDH